MTLVPDAAHEESLPVVAIEVKRADGADSGVLAAFAGEALAQARESRYGAGLAGAGVQLWGVAFSGKRCAATCARA